MSPTQRIVPVLDTNLFVQDTGEQDLPIILCLHSLFLDGRMFDGIADAAAGKFRVIRPDFRGQGRSDLDPTKDQITMDDNADDILALIDQEGWKDMHIVAQSMGGDVAVRIAARRPDLFTSMVMLGSSACAEPADQLEEFKDWLAGVGREGFVGQSLQDTIEIMFGVTTRNNPEKADLITLWTDRITAVNRHLYPAHKGVVFRENAVPLLPSIPFPVLVVSGVEDKPRPPAWAKEVVDNLPNGELWSLEGIGHSPTLEAPELVIPRILEFFRVNS